MRLVHAALATGLLLAAGCAPMPPPESVFLPPSAEGRGAGDPTRGAILASSYAFATPASLAGDPAAAAEALAQLEYLTVELGFGGAWRDMNPLVSTELRRARAETRAALGFRQDASPQVAVNALYGASAALRQGDRATAGTRLAGLAGPGGTEAALARLAALPPLPRAASATGLARDALTRRDSDQDDRMRVF
ncbi:hypothetical protein HB662_16435 [Roseomonas frigidaquae]|uniref:Uncharacterized protein n=1 Tax=Falsiroseomonas frigidaquae TaxID=487318 RepID=A0ABX1F1Y8_9PROT|nr:hypothetical protein [Falsiroseomonas frigidaquae]NKE46371.1 hypothetical protein [Falsiroseomonas frigidaquae]